MLRPTCVSATASTSSTHSEGASASSRANAARAVTESTWRMPNLCSAHITSRHLQCDMMSSVSKLVPTCLWGMTALLHTCLLRYHGQCTQAFTWCGCAGCISTLTNRVGSKRRMFPTCPAVHQQVRVQQLPASAAGRPWAPETQPAPPCIPLLCWVRRQAAVTAASQGWSRSLQS